MSVAEPAARAVESSHARSSQRTGEGNELTRLKSMSIIQGKEEALSPAPKGEPVETEDSERIGSNPPIQDLSVLSLY